MKARREPARLPSLATYFYRVAATLDGVQTPGLPVSFTTTQTLTGTGAFSGALSIFDGNNQQVGGRRTLSGVFNVYGALSGDFGDFGPYLAALALQLSPDERRITGTLRLTENGSEVALLALDLPRLQSTLRPGLSTAFLLNAAAPNDPPLTLTNRPILGAGTLSVTIDQNGRARLVGRLPDGEPFSAKALPNGATLTLSRPIKLYQLGAGGSLNGSVQYLSLAGDDTQTAPTLLDGELTWLKTADPRATHYPEGIAQTLRIDGREYPATARSALPPIGVEGPTQLAAKLHLTGGNLVTPLLDVPLLLLPGSVQLGATPQGLTLKANAKTASFSGSFTHPASNRKTKFTGLFRARSATGNGEGRAVFLGPDEAGSVRLVPE